MNQQSSPCKEYRQAFGTSPHSGHRTFAVADSAIRTTAACAVPSVGEAALLHPGTSLTPSVAELEAYVEQYLQDCDLRLYAPTTIQTRRVFLGNLLWFMRRKGYGSCGTLELRQFFYYLAHGHEEPGGRFGNRNLTRPARPITIADYYHCLRSFFDWLVTQGVICETPFSKIAKPRVHEESKSPLSAEQVAALLRATAASANPDRNLAIVTFLLDTGCRASELVSIRRKDLDLENGRCRVLGKGNRYRTIFFGEKTTEALARFLAGREEDLERPLFPPARGSGEFTRSGLRHLIKRLGAVAGIKDEVCVHALRRSFAVQLLRNGANVFSVQSMLGHSNLTQTRKYCQLALADAESQHRLFSLVRPLSSCIRGCRNLTLTPAGLSAPQAVGGRVLPVLVLDVRLGDGAIPPRHG